MPSGSGYAHLSNVCAELDRSGVGVGFAQAQVIGMMILRLHNLFSPQEGLGLPLRPPGLSLVLYGSHRMTKRTVTIPSVKLR